MGVTQRSRDYRFMGRALELASNAKNKDEVPVGAVVVRNNEIIGEGYNRPIASHDPTGHAEIIALRDAASSTRNYRVSGSTLYVTLEPCIMCAGAILHARVERLVFGAWDPEFGAAGSQLNLLQSRFLNHRCAITSGILQQQCGEIIQQFFKEKR